MDEDDFRSRAREFSDGFAEAFEDLWPAPTSTTPARRSCAPPSRGGSPRRACASTSAPAASWPWRCAPAFPGADRLPRQQQDDRRDPRGADLRGRPHRRRLLRGDRPDRRGGSRARRRRAGHGPGDGRRRGAHPRVHRHRPRGPEVRLQPRRRPGARGGYAGCWPGPTSSTCSVCTATSAARSSTPAASRWRPAALVGLHAGVARRARPPLPRDRPRRWLRHRLHLAAHPLSPSRRWRRRWPTSSSASQGRRRRRQRPGAPGSRSSPGAPSSGPAPSPSTRWAPSRTSRSRAAHSRTYVSVDGGMSDNVRPALYEADYSCTLASRAREAAPRPVPRRRAGTARAATSSCSTSTSPPTSCRATCIAVPVTGAYCRSLSSQYNHIPRPPVVAVRGGASTRARAA